MSFFYGTLTGKGKKQTATGTKDSGMVTVTASHAGSVEVEAYTDTNGRACVHVSLRKWQGHGVNRVLYHGPLDPESVHIEKLASEELFAGE